MIDYHYN